MAALVIQEERRGRAYANKRGSRVVRVALAGCGVVGGELARLLVRLQRTIEQRQGIRLEVVKVLVRDTARLRPVNLARGLFTNDIGQFLACDADIVVEAIGGVSPAQQIAQATLARGARFVTANKALLAECGDELLETARASGATLDFEAAIGGGVPVVRALRSSLRDASVQRIEAILNGTTNYILTRLERGAAFDVALADAQRSGFAEADPTRDLDGTDSADKLRLLAWLAFGLSPRALSVDCRGVLPDPEKLVREAAAADLSVRLIASCERIGSEVTATVEPLFVARDTAFARTFNEQNLVVVDFGWNQPITLSGPGAGGLPTATALLGDILSGEVVCC